MYYEGTGVSSVYLWDVEGDPHGFAGVVLLKKVTKAEVGTTVGAAGENGKGNARMEEGNWDSIHVFECTEKGRQGIYKLTSTVSDGKDLDDMAE